MNEETKIPTAKGAVAAEDKGRCAPADGSAFPSELWRRTFSSPVLMWVVCVNLCLVNANVGSSLNRLCAGLLFLATLTSPYWLRRKTPNDKLTDGRAKNHTA